MKKITRNIICYLIIFCMLVPQLAIAVPTIDHSTSDNQVLLKVENGQVSFAKEEGAIFRTIIQNNRQNDVEYLYATKLSSDIYLSGEQYFIDCGNEQLLYAERHTLNLKDSSIDDIKSFGNSVGLAQDQINEIINSKGLVSIDADEESSVSVYSAATSPVYSDWVVGYSGEKYRTMIIEFNNLGSEYKNIASGIDTNTWLQNTAVVLLEMTVDNLLGNSFSILSGLSSLTSLMGGGTITATKTSKLQFGGGWDKTTKYTYIYGDQYWKVCCSKIYIKEIDFNFYDPSASVINRSYNTFPNKTLYSTHYNDTNYCQQYAYNMKGSYNSLNEQFSRYAVYGGPNQQYVAYVSF